MQRHSMAEWLFKRKSLFLDLTIRCSPTGDHLSQNCWPLSGVSRTPQCKAPMQHTPCALWQFVLHCCYLQWADVASCHSSSVQWWLHGMRSWLALCRKCFQQVLKELKTLCWKYPMHQNVPSVSKSHPWSTGSPYINRCENETGSHWVRRVETPPNGMSSRDCSPWVTHCAAGTPLKDCVLWGTCSWERTFRDRAAEASVVW